MSTTRFTITNTIIEGNAEYLSVPGSIQYSYTFIRYLADPALDTLTSVKVNGNTISSLVGTSRDQIYDLNGKKLLFKNDFEDEKISMQNFSKGIYSIKIYLDKNHFYLQ